MATEHSPPIYSVFCWADRQHLCAKKRTVHRMCIPILFCACDNGEMPRITLRFRTLPTDVVFARSSRSLPRRTPASESFSFRRIFPSLCVRGSGAKEYGLIAFPRFCHRGGNYKRLLLCSISMCWFTWLSISPMALCVRLDSYPPRHPRDAKKPNHILTQRRNSHRHRSRRTTAACPGLFGA